MKTLEDQGAIIKTPTKRGSSFFFSKSLPESTDNNSNTVNPIPTVLLPCNTPVCPNCNTDISLLSEIIDSLKQFLDAQLQNLTHTSSVKSTRREEIIATSLIY